MHKTNMSTFHPANPNASWRGKGIMKNIPIVVNVVIMIISVVIIVFMKTADLLIDDIAFHQGRPHFGQCPLRLWPLLFKHSDRANQEIIIVVLIQTSTVRKQQWKEWRIALFKRIKLKSNTSNKHRAGETARFANKIEDTVIRITYALLKLRDWRVLTSPRTMSSSHTFADMLSRCRFLQHLYRGGGNRKNGKKERQIRTEGVTNNKNTITAMLTYLKPLKQMHLKFPFCHLLCSNRIII